MTNHNTTDRHVWMKAGGCPFCAAGIDHGDPARVLVLSIEGTDDALVLLGDPSAEPLKGDGSSEALAYSLVRDGPDGFVGGEPGVIDRIVATVWRDIAIPGLGYSESSAFVHVSFDGDQPQVTWYEDEASRDASHASTLSTNALWAMQVVGELTSCAYLGEIHGLILIEREELPAIACFVERVSTASVAAMAGDVADQWAIEVPASSRERALFEAVELWIMELVAHQDENAAKARFVDAPAQVAS